MHANRTRKRTRTQSVRVRVSYLRSIDLLGHVNRGIRISCRRRWWLGRLGRQCVLIVVVQIRLSHRVRKLTLISEFAQASLSESFTEVRASIPTVSSSRIGRSMSCLLPAAPTELTGQEHVHRHVHSELQPELHSVVKEHRRHRRQWHGWDGWQRNRLLRKNE